MDKFIVPPTCEKFPIVQGSSPATPVKNVVIDNLSIIGSDFSQVWTPGEINPSPNPQGMIFGENVEGSFKEVAGSYVNKNNRIESNFIHDWGKVVGTGLRTAVITDRAQDLRL